MPSATVRESYDKYAELSEDGVYRRMLSRTWNSSKGFMTYIMLNPSTADAVKDDQTIRKCVHYARREDFGGISVVNLFDLRCTDPKKLFAGPHPPVTAENGKAIMRNVAFAGKIVCAWGANADHKRVFAQAQGLYQYIRMASTKKLWCLGVTKNGHPVHPLMLRNDQPIIPWSGYP